MHSFTSSTVATFQHEPLPDAANHIRLLEVLDDNYSDTIKICCRITIWPTDSLPSYHAISYAWGDPESNTTILVNDQPFQARTNCESALKQARWHAKSRFHWIDAICIDQENLNEKEKQVAMMGNIYKKADHVLACIGDHTDDSRFVFQNLERFLPIVREGELLRKSSILRLYRKHGFSTTRRFIHSTIILGRRPYFNRLWVLQELKNARQASLLCGLSVVSKDDFHAILRRFACYLAYDKPFPTPVWKLVSSLWRLDAIYKHHSLQGNLKRHTANIDSIYSTVALLGKSLHPVDLVSISCYLQCTIRRDKVYGIISILDLGDSATIIPNYTKPDFEVALDLLRAIWNTDLVQDERGRQLLELCFVTIDNLDLLGRHSDGIPEALEARGGSLERTSKSTETGLNNTLPRARSITIGWRVSVEDLTGDHAGFKSLNPPGPNKSKIYLPYWIKEGDWALHWRNDFLENIFLVVREEADSLCMPVVGHAWCASFDSTKLNGTAFEVYWSPEDVLLFTMIRLELNGRDKFSNAWIEKLNSGVCRRETPGSSYGVKRWQQLVVERALG